MPRHNTHIVTLPAAAAQAAYDFGDDDKFTFSPTNAQGAPSDVPPMDDLPAGAMVPGEIPPDGVLPAEAEMNMSQTAMDQPEVHFVPWWLVG